MARPKTKTNAEVKNTYAQKTYDDIRLQVKKGNKDKLKQIAADRGYKHLQTYIKYLLERDTGLDL